MSSRLANIAATLFVACFLLSSPINIFGISNQTVSSSERINHPTPPNFTPAAKKVFAFVSEFESNGISPWSVVSGAKPKIVGSPSYGGEPALESSFKDGLQVNYASKGIVAGVYLTFQVAIYPTPGSSAFFGLGTSNGTFVALVGVDNDEVVTGSNPSTLTDIENIPITTAQPPGWVYLSATVYKASGGPAIEVFVDQSETYNADVYVPSFLNYTGALIETSVGQAYYTDIVVTTNRISDYDPGYNNMEGYGQGTAINVKLLPEFYNLTAEMTLNNWSTPQNNELSFQINAMNMTGATKSTCHGFFQLGADLNNNSYIAPWYVPGINCGAKYFDHSKGIYTPQGSKLVLSIVWSSASSSINFTINDESVGRVFSTSIPYNGGGFYSVYTQVEFQPCCNDYAISDYKFQGSLYNLQIVEMNGTSEYLSASYMIPYNVDFPTSWNYNYYVVTEAGYNQESL